MSNKQTKQKTAIIVCLNKTWQQNLKTKNKTKKQWKFEGNFQSKTNKNNKKKLFAKNKRKCNNFHEKELARFE